MLENVFFLYWTKSMMAVFVGCLPHVCVNKVLHALNMILQDHLYLSNQSLVKPEIQRFQSNV